MADTPQNTNHGPRTTDHGSRLISLGVITAAHGIRGEVKVRSFTANPQDITAYGPLLDASGRHFNITITGGTKDTLIAKVEGVSSRNEAEALRNTELFIPRSALPEPDAHEYYHEDLIGLSLMTADGKPYGVIAAMHNFGAGDLAAIRQESGEEEMLPFTRETFTQIDLAKGTAVIVPPEMISEKD